MAKRRKFSDEFKREAVRLATQSGVTKSQIGRELGLELEERTRESHSAVLLGTPECVALRVTSGHWAERIG